MCILILYTYNFHSIYSYHQKYLLRQQREIVRGLGLSDAELITSHAACRLNGYVGGYGKLEDLKQELPRFKLGPKVVERIKAIVSQGSLY